MEILRKLNKSPYRDQKERNPDRIPGTCEWFVAHDLFRDWRESRSSTMLWVSADPGCGKSVLAKYLVDSVLATESRTTCYFFFKDDFEDQRTVISALCCTLRQLFIQKRILLSEVILEQFESGGETFTSSFWELWDTLLRAAEDKNAGEIVCLLDAIDECDDRGRSVLAEALCKLYSTWRNFNLKFLLTSRSYGAIRQGFQPLDIPGLPVIHLSGENDVEMKKISQEIDIFIKARVCKIGAQLKLKGDEQGILLQELMRIPNRTYLWVHLTLDLIQNNFNIDKTGITNAASHLPQTVNEAYNRILSKSRDIEKAKKILHIVVAAARHLTLSEMALALAIRENRRSYSDLDLQSQDRVRESIRDICGLFVTIINSRIYLLHQTAKEFLVQTDQEIHTQSVHGDLEWKHSLQPQESHRVLTEICMQHLLFTEFEAHPLDEDAMPYQYVENHVFLDYSAKHWTTHLHKSHIKVGNATIQSILKLCDTNSERCLTWFRIYWTSTNTDFPEMFTSLMIASYFGLTTVANLLLKLNGVDINCKDGTYGRSALSWAAGNGFDVAAQLLIKGTSRLPFKNRRAQVDSVDRHGRTPLVYAIWNGHVAVVKLLLKAGASIGMRDDIGGTPLSYAVCNGHNDVLKLLFRKGAKADFGDDISMTLLLSAAKKNQEAVVKLLLETGKTNPDLKDENGRTPLSWSVEKGHETIVKLLLETGKVNPDLKDENGRTPLSWSVEKGHETIVKLLLETGKVSPDLEDKSGRTPLSWALEKGHETIVKLLLETGKVNPDLEDESGQTLLSWALEKGHETIVKLLLETGKFSLNLKFENGRTPLLWAMERGYKALFKLLLETDKVNPDLEDATGQTPLSQAVREGSVAVVQLLVARGVKTDYKYNIVSKSNHI
jgi:ankyrin repeat domain-containing protein 50